MYQCRSMLTVDIGFSSAFCIGPGPILSQRSGCNRQQVETLKMFGNMKFYIHPAKFSKGRLNLFSTQIVNHGGMIVKSSEEATHVIVEESCDTSLLPTSFWLDNSNVVGSMWLSQSLKEKSVVDHHQFSIAKPSLKRFSSPPETPCKRETNQQTSSKDIVADLSVKKYACSQPSIKNSDLCNATVLAQLQKLANTYRARGDQWRAHGYEKAISAIRRHGKEITSYEEVVLLEGVGRKMAGKVMEVIATGRLRKVEELCGTEEALVMDVFSNIWGAGPSTAHAWYIKGYRSLDDLVQKENLTKQQNIGIKYYKEFLDRMSRKEVEEIGQKVDEAASLVDSSLTTMLCGSYRRGKQTCRDVDVVVIKPDNLNSKEILNSILSRLKDVGFITDDLVSLEKSGNQRKYLGVCKLPGDDQKHRRLDIFVVPKSEEACAIMHYTGSALFNRSIRLLAQKKNMCLSEHRLCAGVVRQGKEIEDGGHVLPTPTEESIFKHLDLEYRHPEERDH